MTRLHMTARQTFGREVDDGSDEVLFGLTLPSGSIVHGIHAEISYVCGSISAGANLFAAVRMGAISVEGWILPILDPDAGASWDAVWDALVPKDTDVDVMDLDSVATDATSFFEPGEMAMANLFNVGLQPRRIYHHHKILSIADGAVGVVQDNQTPFQLEYTPGGKLTINIGRNIAVSQPSLLAFAFGVPLMDDTAVGVPTVLSESQIPQVKYMRDVLSRAMLHQLGLIEAGAETPWEEASALLRLHLNPDIFEDTAGLFVTQGEYIVAGEVTIRHSVTGEMILGNVSTGR